MSVNARVILLVGYDKTMYTRINEKIDSHITQKLTSLSAFGFILKDFFFLETDVGKCEGRTFGWTRLYTR